jgi:hypothetical protein
VNVTDVLSPYIMSAVGKKYCHASSCYTGELAVAPSFVDWASTCDRFMQGLGALHERHRVYLMEKSLISDARAFNGTDVAKKEANTRLKATKGNSNATATTLYEAINRRRFQFANPCSGPVSYIQKYGRETASCY